MAAVAKLLYVLCGTAQHRWLGDFHMVHMETSCFCFYECIGYEIMIAGNDTFNELTW